MLDRYASLGENYDRDLADVFAIQSEVAQEIADSLKAKLSPAEANTVASAPTKDTEAYDLFLKGEFEHRVANSNFRPEAFDEATRCTRRRSRVTPISLWPWRNWLSASCGDIG